MGGDPFQTLGLEPGFDLSRDEIERRYLALAGSVHPDISTDDRVAHARSAELNDARAVLADPERRAGALLARFGGPAPEQNKSLPPEFLAEIMEVREEVDAAVRAGDTARVAEWSRWARERRARLIRDVAAQFGALGSTPAAAPLAAIRQSLNAWRYIERMIEQTQP